MRVLVCALLLLGPLASGCSEEDDPAPAVEPAALPENLCDVVPAHLREQWGLAEKTHDTSALISATTAGCALTGRYLGSPLTLLLQLTSFGGEDRKHARSEMTTQLELACADLSLAASASAELTTDDNGCSLREPTGDVAQVARSIPASGVAEVSVTYDGENPSAVAAETQRLLETLTSDPAELR
ncbi:MULTISPECIES: hypothetical protein [unclassified Nocardioides]|uniref:hypothetical protein n=1 Tax=unclassified Nocardioides TaxID=2615069 RepID=UPI000B2E6971|nr:MULTISPECIES: hypothetical protein [unclassified Nocardioides]